MKATDPPPRLYRILIFSTSFSLVILFPQLSPWMAQQYLSPSSSWQNHSSLLPNHPFCFQAQKLSGMSAKAVESTSIKSVVLTSSTPALLSPTDFVFLSATGNAITTYLFGGLLPHTPSCCQNHMGNGILRTVISLTHLSCMWLKNGCLVFWARNILSTKRCFSAIPHFQILPFYSSCLTQDRLSRPPTEKLSKSVTLSPQVFVPLLQHHPHRAATASLLRQHSCSFFCLNLTDSFWLTALFPWKLRFSSCWEVW